MVIGRMSLPQNLDVPVERWVDSTGPLPLFQTS